MIIIRALDKVVALVSIIAGIFLVGGGSYIVNELASRMSASGLGVGATGILGDLAWVIFIPILGVVVVVAGLGLWAEKIWARIIIATFYIALLAVTYAWYGNLRTSSLPLFRVMTDGYPWLSVVPTAVMIAAGVMAVCTLGQILTNPS